MKLYHGSILTVKKPNIKRGRTNADFGKGFYTTSNREQAIRWANIRKERENASSAIVSVYDFDESLLNNLKWNIRQFTGADEAWLYFVTNCRKSRSHDFDIVLGPVANDNVFTTVNLFESGIINVQAALMQLKAYKTYDQISFHTERAIASLQYIESFAISED